MSALKIEVETSRQVQTLPSHRQHRCDMCDEADNDYCFKCGTPHGAMRDLVEGEWSDQLDRMYW